MCSPDSVPHDFSQSVLYITHDGFQPPVLEYAWRAPGKGRGHFSQSESKVGSAGQLCGTHHSVYSLGLSSHSLPCISCPEPSPHPVGGARAEERHDPSKLPCCRAAAGTGSILPSGAVLQRPRFTHLPHIRGTEKVLFSF